MEKMASDIALAAELKLYKIAAEGEKEIKKPKAPKTPKSPAPAKAPKAAQPPKSNGGVKPPMNAGQEKGLKTRMMTGLQDISRSNVPRDMSAMTMGAGMIPPGMRGYAGEAAQLSADPAGAMDFTIGENAGFSDNKMATKALSEVLDRNPYLSENREPINSALRNAWTSQHENDYRNKIRNLLGFDF